MKDSEMRQAAAIFGAQGGKKTAKDYKGKHAEWGRKGAKVREINKKNLSTENP